MLNSAVGGQAAPSLAVLLGRRPRLVLADDDDEIRWALTELFESQGYEVTATPSGAGLMDIIADSLLLDGSALPPDVIITDVRMPFFNGLGVVDGLRRVGWTTPIIVISAFCDGEIRARVERLGDSQLLHKPIDPNEIEDMVDRAIRARH